MEKHEIVESLVKHLGHKEEIEGSLTGDSGRYAEWGAAGSFECDGIEYNYIESEDEAIRIATEMVEDNLENDPELFELNFLSDHVYMEPYDIRFHAGDEADAHVDGLEEESFFEESGIDPEGEEGTPEYEKSVEEARQAVWQDVFNRVSKELTLQPLSYFNEVGFTIKDLLDKNLVKIDIPAAAEAAIAADGWAHFLSLYDGDYKVTDSGIVFFRE